MLNFDNAGAFSDLHRYHPHPEDKGVIAWATDHAESKSGSKEVKFTVKAMSIELSPYARARQEAYDRMVRQASREARRGERASRGKGGEHEADEL